MERGKVSKIVDGVDGGNEGTERGIGFLFPDASNLGFGRMIVFVFQNSQKESYISHEMIYELYMKCYLTVLQNTTTNDASFIYLKI